MDEINIQELVEHFGESLKDDFLNVSRLGLDSLLKKTAPHSRESHSIELLLCFFCDYHSDNRSVSDAEFDNFLGWFIEKANSISDYSLSKTIRFRFAELVEQNLNHGTSLPEQIVLRLKTIAMIYGMGKGFSNRLDQLV